MLLAMRRASAIVRTWQCGVFLLKSAKATGAVLAGTSRIMPSRKPLIAAVLAALGLAGASPEHSESSLERLQSLLPTLAPAHRSHPAGITAEDKAAEEARHAPTARIEYTDMESSIDEGLWIWKVAYHKCFQSIMQAKLADLDLTNATLQENSQVAETAKHPKS